MTAQPTERDRATAGDLLAVPVYNLVAGAATDDTMDDVEAKLAALTGLVAQALAAEREAALRPVLALVAELDRLGHSRRYQLARLTWPRRIAARIYAACSGQGYANAIVSSEQSPT